MGKKMKSAPVYFVIGQVQHNPLLNLSSYLAVIQERMRKAGYPDFKRAVQMQFDLSPAMAVGGDADQAPQPAVQKVERFLFSDVTSTSSFVLQTNSLSFQTTEYDTFETFSTQLAFGLTILGEAVGGLSFMERLGLRYLDAVAPKPSEMLNQYLAPELLGLSMRLPEAKFAYSFAEAVLLEEGVGQVVSRTVIRNGPLGFPPDLHPDGLKVSDRFQSVSGEHAVIDTDGSFTGRRAFDMAEVQSRMEGLHDL
ncbi:MAG: TIGR04255 family protein, partial [Pyrinomonadaceae bacterium]